ncbi:hypothetical protein MAY82_17335 [Edwardsiella ictaluri]|nr:hypothetical protein [Edwardsiella ictaluri]WFO12722.1 hypothetical protein MAY82_17335 [Edwardsiella ictaluri]
MSKRHTFRAGRSLDALYENVELMTGQRGDGQDKAITARDLVALGLARPLRGQGGELHLRPGLGGRPGPMIAARLIFHRRRRDCRSAADLAPCCWSGSRQRMAATH